MLTCYKKHLTVVLANKSFFLFCLGVNGGTVNSTVTSQQEGPEFDSTPWPGPFCVEFACSVFAWVLSGYSAFLPQNVE